MFVFGFSQKLTNPLPLHRHENHCLGTNGKIYISLPFLISSTYNPPPQIEILGEGMTSHNLTRVFEITKLKSFNPIPPLISLVSCSRRCFQSFSPREACESVSLLRPFFSFRSAAPAPVTDSLFFSSFPVQMDQGPRPTPPEKLDEPRFFHRVVFCLRKASPPSFLGSVGPTPIFLLHFLR